MEYEIQILQALNRLIELEEARIPLGSRTHSVTVSDEMRNEAFGVPWISFSVTNDGLGDVYMAINDGVNILRECAIKVNESYSVDMVYPIITNIYLKAESGTTATVRFRGIYGKKVSWLRE